jgi:Flp pilus assembly protein TadD
VQRLLQLAGAAVVLVSLAAPAAAAQKWTRVRTRNFVLVGDASERDIRNVGQRLEQFREVLARVLPKARGNSAIPTVVLVFASDRSYGPFKPLYEGKAKEGVAGTFVPAPDVNHITLSVDRGEFAYPVIFHEYAHSVVDSVFTWTPLWFNEGLANYYSSFSMAGTRRAEIGGVPPEYVHLLRERSLVPLPELLAVTRESPHYNERDRSGVFYAQSWALVHYLTLGNEARQPQFYDFLKKVLGGRPADEAFREAFACEPAKLEGELRRYVGGMVFKKVIVTFSESVDVDAGAAERISDAEANTYLADLLMRMARTDEARTRLDTALAQEPDSVRAHTLLGLLNAITGRFNDAMPLLERAVTLAPDDPFPHYQLGAVMVRKLSEDGGAGASPEFLEKARTSLTRAVALRPDMPDALGMLGYVQLIEGTDLDAARKAFEQARTLAPARVQYAFGLAQVLVRQEDIAAAQRILGPLAASPDADVRSQAREMLGSLTLVDQEIRRRQDGNGATRSEPSNTALDEPQGTAAMEQPGTTGSKGAEPASQASATPASGRGSGNRPRPVFRTLGEGEQQARGVFVALDCTGARMVLRVKASDRELHLWLRKTGSVEFITFRSDLEGTVACGLRRPPDPVLVTWKPLPNPPGETAGLDGEAVAMEFLPLDYQ